MNVFVVDVTAIAPIHRPAATEPSVTTLTAPVVVPKICSIAGSTAEPPDVAVPCSYLKFATTRPVVAPPPRGRRRCPPAATVSRSAKRSAPPSWTCRSAGS
jgi:hypothetical protein